MARFGERGFRKTKARIWASFYGGIPDGFASDLHHLHHVSANSCKQFVLQIIAPELPQMPHA
jgi:hypothetical protein